MREQIEDKAATQSFTPIGRHYYALAGGTKKEVVIQECGVESLQEAGPCQVRLMGAGITEKTDAVENAACARAGKKHPGFSFPPALQSHVSTCHAATQLTEEPRKELWGQSCCDTEQSKDQEWI